MAPPYSYLSRLQNLRSLHLENFRQNDMTVVNTNLNFPELLTLTLNKLQAVTHIDENVFSNIAKVTKLNLQRMHSLSTLPVPAILKLLNLQIINIFDTWITHIYGESFKGLNSLNSIHIDSNEKLVSLASNAFSGVEDTLRFLYLSQNALNSNVLGIFATTSWPALTQLHLGYNYFGNIPAGTFRTMPNLVYLELQDIELSSVDISMFTGLPKLHTLDLAYNKITSIGTGSFQGNTELKELRLNEQQTNGRKILFGANAFQGVETSLQRLFIERNTLDTSDLWQIIKTFTNILELNMASLSLTEIPDRAFENNAKLSNLDLSDNNISTMNQETFYGPRNNLKYVNMNYNQIETISKCVFSDFSIQPEIRITGNALVCDCRVAWLYDWVHQQTDVDGAAFNYVGKCSSPAGLRDKYFNMFDRSELTCPPGYVEPVCPDVYATTTTIPTTTIKVASPPTSIPDFYLLIGRKTSTYITLVWAVSDKTNVSGYRLSIFVGSTSNIALMTSINRDQSQYTYSFTPGKSYIFCLAVLLTDHRSQPKCVSASAPAPDQTTTSVIPTIVTSAPSTTTDANLSSNKPPLIFLLFVKHTTHTSITLSWTITDDSDVDLYVMELSTDDEATMTFYINKGHSEFTVRNLLPGHSYYVCLFLMRPSGQDKTHRSCETASTLRATTTTNTPSTGKGQNGGVIIG